MDLLQSCVPHILDLQLGMYSSTSASLYVVFGCVAIAFFNVVLYLIRMTLITARSKCKTPSSSKLSSLSLCLIMSMISLASNLTTFNAIGQTTKDSILGINL